MHTSVSKYDFMEAFCDMDRYEQFGYDALSALFDYFEDMEKDTGEEVELDVIAVCCNYTVSTLEEVRDEYDLDDDTDVLEYLMDSTFLIATLPDGRVLYQNF
jgi:hypothetical protein